MDFTKAEIRKKVESQRTEQDALEKSQKDKVIQEFLFSIKEFMEAKTISIYISMAREVATRDMIKELFGLGKTIAVPFLKGNKPYMCLLESAENLAGNTPFFKDSRNEVRPEQLDLVIVPGFAFDRKGGRLGGGRGYYDTFLKEVREKVPIIALAYDFQIFKDIPREPHDVSVDKIVTEKGIIIC